MKWVETQGRKPRTGDKLLHQRIARWTHVGDPWDVVAVARVVGE